MAAQKQSVGGLGPKFNPKILLYGDPGQGKTTFAGSYTKGKTHVYNFDPQGLSVLRENINDITADVFSDTDHKKGDTYNQFWKQLQKDDKDGLFKELYESEGLVVFDSYTSLENYMVDYVALNILRKKTASDGVYHIERQDWPKVTPYVINFFKVVTVLPCAVLVVCHRKSIQDADANLFFRPTIIGQQAEQIARWFSEYLRCSLRNGKFIVQTQGNTINPAGSRLFLPGSGVKSLTDPTLDDLYDYWHTGKLNCKHS